MVIKTDTCSFSEFRIYPGHGQRFVRKDGTPYALSTAKCMSLFRQRKKPAKLLWTQAWRRMHKKLKVDEVSRKRTRKTTKFQRAVVGVSADEIASRRAQKPEVRAAQREANLRDIKERNKAKKEKAAAARKAAMKNTHKKR